MRREKSLVLTIADLTSRRIKCFTVKTAANYTLPHLIPDLRPWRAQASTRVMLVWGFRTERRVFIKYIYRYRRGMSTSIRVQGRQFRW